MVGNSKSPKQFDQTSTQRALYKFRMRLSLLDIANKRSTDQVVSDLVQWQLTHAQRSRGRHVKTLHQPTMWRLQPKPMRTYATASQKCPVEAVGVDNIYSNGFHIIYYMKWWSHCLSSNMTMNWFDNKRSFIYLFSVII